MALPRANRLRSRQDFNAVYRKGIRRRSENLTLLVLRHRSTPLSQPLELPPVATSIQQQPTRLGISISQKVSKRAVVRNRIKRQLHAGFCLLLPSFPIGWDVVVVVQPRAVQCDYRQFLQELEQLLIDAEVRDGH